MRLYGLLLGFHDGPGGSLPATHLGIPPEREGTPMLCSHKGQIFTIPLFYRWGPWSPEGGKGSGCTTEWVKGRGRVLSYPHAPNLIGSREAAPLRVFPSESLTFPKVRGFVLGGSPSFSQQSVDSSLSLPWTFPAAPSSLYNVFLSKSKNYPPTLQATLRTLLREY